MAWIDQNRSKHDFPEESLTPSLSTIVENIEDYFQALPAEQTEKVLNFFISEKERRGVDPFYVDIYKMLQRGTQSNNVLLAIHDVSKLRMLLKFMFSIPLWPLSGFRAIQNLLDYLSEEATSRYIQGFYNPLDNKILVAVDPTFLEDILRDKTDKYRNSDLIPSKSFTEYVILHEACHFFESNHPDAFLNLFGKPVLFPFYTEYLKSFYRRHVDNATRAYGDDLFEKAAEVMVQKLIVTKDTEHTAKNYRKIVRDTRDALNSVVPKLGDMWFYTDPFSADVQLAMFRGYTKVGVDAGIVEIFNMYQETYCVSEVVAVTAFQTYVYGGKLKPLYSRMMRGAF